MKHNDVIVVRIVMDIWYEQITLTNKVLSGLSDNLLLQKVAAGRSTGQYLLGHLTAVHDKLFPILGICNTIFPHYEELFIENSDSAGMDYPPLYELKQAWSNVNIQLAKSFKQMRVDEWFQRHSQVSEADFAKAPHRNKLNIVLSRANHTGYYRGQLILLTAQEHSPRTLR